MLSLQEAEDSAARTAILAALVANGGSRAKAAESLQTTPRTLYRRIVSLDLWGEIDRLAAVHGWADREGAFARVS